MVKSSKKDLFSGLQLNGGLKRMEPMADHTSLRIGGPADRFAELRDLTSIVGVYQAAEENRIPMFFLGGGTNILVKDGGVEGIVISFQSLRRIEVLRIDDTTVHLKVEAGTPLQRLVNFARTKGYAGIEGLTGIPGTVGGAIRGNAGAFGYEMKDSVAGIQIIDTGAKLTRVKASDIDFFYRGTNILPHQMILYAEIRLGRDSSTNVASRTDHFFQEKKARQPLWEQSAGCVFKNPRGMSAGKLIEEAGCKGIRIGDIEVSTVHANFFINRGRGSAADFLALMEHVSIQVEKKTRVLLEPELKIIGRDEVET